MSAKTAKTWPDVAEEMVRLRDLSAAAKDSTERKRLEVLMFETSRGVDEHPEDWNHSCGCNLCLSYAD